jgi:hypothetical protein
MASIVYENIVIWTTIHHFATPSSKSILVSQKEKKMWIMYVHLELRSL